MANPYESPEHGGRTPAPSLMHAAMRGAIYGGLIYFLGLLALTVWLLNTRPPEESLSGFVGSYSAFMMHLVWDYLKTLLGCIVLGALVFVALAGPRRTPSE